MVNSMVFNKWGIVCHTTAIFVVCRLVASCARKISFDISSVVPAAQGAGKVKMDKNGNHSIKINFKYLAHPVRLQPPKSVYVVWIESSGKGTQNLGQLKTSSGMFSKALKASMETASLFKQHLHNGRRQGQYRVSLLKRRIET